MSLGTSIVENKSTTMITTARKTNIMNPDRTPTRAGETSSTGRRTRRATATGRAETGATTTTRSTTKKADKPAATGAIMIRVAS
jgi:hypothetical protein